MKKGCNVRKVRDKKAVQQKSRVVVVKGVASCVDCGVYRY
jgi:hypothetical protein